MPVARSLADLTAAVAGRAENRPRLCADISARRQAAGARRTAASSRALAATLEQLAHAGLDDFYRGDVAREIAADLERVGAPVTRADLEAMRATLTEPLSVTLGAGTLYNTPPPTPGLAALIMLALFERLGSREAESFDHIHGLVEAAKRALARARPLHHRSRPACRIRPTAISPTRSSTPKPPRSIAAGPGPWQSSQGAGDTIWMGAADASGLVVSYIQSLYWEFGSGLVLPRTGVLMQNRGTGFSLEPTARNRLEPGRLPPHTLNPALAVLRDGRVMAYGTMGGDAQPQIQAALFTRHVAYRQPLDEALDRPRWFVGRTWGSAHGSVCWRAASTAT